MILEAHRLLSSIDIEHRRTDQNLIGGPHHLR